MAGGPAGQRPAHVGRAPVAVGHGAPGHVAAAPRPFEGRDDGRRVVPRLHRPAHDHAGREVDDRREAGPPLAGPQAGRVAHGHRRGHGPCCNFRPVPDAWAAQFLVRIPLTSY